MKEITLNHIVRKVNDMPVLPNRVEKIKPIQKDLDLPKEDLVKFKNEVLSQYTLPKNVSFDLATIIFWA